MKVAGKKFGSIRVFPICPTLELMDQMLVANLLESISIVNDCKKKMSNKSWSKHIRYKNMQQSGLFIFFFFLIIDILLHKQATVITACSVMKLSVNFLIFVKFYGQFTITHCFPAFWNKLFWSIKMIHTSHSLFVQNVFNISPTYLEFSTY